MTSLPPYLTLIPPPPYPQPPPPQPIQLRHPYTPSLPPPSLPTCHPYNPYHPPLPFFTPPQFFWPTFGQGPPPPLVIPVPIASYIDNVSHPSTIQPKPTVTPTQPPNVSHPSTFQPKPTVTPTQPPKPQHPKPKPQSGGLERISAIVRIDSKVFSLASDGGRIDSYAIYE